MSIGMSDAVVASTRPLAPALTKDELHSIKLRNQNMRQIIYKEVKLPGKDHRRLFRMLHEDLHCPPNIRQEYIRDVIREDKRFLKVASAGRSTATSHKYWNEKL